MKCNLHPAPLTSHIINTMTFLVRSTQMDTNNYISGFIEPLLVCIAIHQVMLVIFVHSTLVVMVGYEAILDPSR